MTPEQHDPQPDLVEFADLVVALEEGRPRPTGEFTERLDSAVADHFPREWSLRAEEGPRRGGRLRRWLDAPSRRLLPVTAAVAGVLVIAVSVQVGLRGEDGESANQTGGSTSREATSTDQRGTSQSTYDSLGEYPRVRKSESGGAAILKETDPATDSAVANSQPTEKSRVLSAAPFADRVTRQSAIGPNAAGVQNRKVAQKARIVLGTSPENVQDVSNEIIAVVDDHDGIVLDSSVEDGIAGQAGARFSLMIPSAELEGAIADLSGVADLRSRTQETEDVTAPVLTLEDELQTARARVKSLVTELEEATSEEQRDEVEAKLGSARRKASRVETRLNRLQRKVNLTPVAVRVETGADESGDGDSGWSIDDAVDDAGRMLGVTAGVALVALAIAIPIGLVILIALAINRAWVRRSRRRALDRE